MRPFWQWKSFKDFTDPIVLYRMLQLRQQVFIVEQSCLYADIDGQDTAALHLLGWTGDVIQPELVAYARLFLPQKIGDHVNFGRVVVNPAFRGIRLGDQLIEQMLNYIKDSSYADQPITISAQHHLVQFYQKFKFYVVGEPYDEDGILHVAMRKEIK